MRVTFRPVYSGEITHGTHWILEVALAKRVSGTGLLLFTKQKCRVVGRWDISCFCRHLRLATRAPPFCRMFGINKRQSGKLCCLQPTQKTERRENSFRISNVEADYSSSSLIPYSKSATNHYYSFKNVLHEERVF